MKKFMILACAAIAFASCTTTIKTAKTADSAASLLSATVADLDVSPNRVKVEFVPSPEIRRGGVSNVKHAAEQKALEDGNYDVLVNAEYTIQKTNYGIFGKKIDKVIVTGHPAKYKNYHSLNDSVWCNPAFRFNYQDQIKKDNGGLLKGLFK